jgi:uncharacterized membrane protein YphA (DoxX/SURF4 family)
MIPVVAPPLRDSHQGTGRADWKRAPRIKAPAGGARNAYNLVTHERATWREAVVGSAFLLGVATTTGSVVAAALAVRRRRNRRD